MKNYFHIVSDKNKISLKIRSLIEKKIVRSNIKKSQAKVVQDQLTGPELVVLRFLKIQVKAIQIFFSELWDYLKLQAV